MKKLIISFAAALAAFGLCAVPAYAQSSSLGFWGGISEGIRLPKTTEELLADGNNADIVMPYKELIFLDGAPVTFEGSMTIASDVMPEDVETGTFNVQYQIAGTAANIDIDIERDIDFLVRFRKVENQTVYSYSVENWDEIIVTPAAEYELVPEMSHFDISILEDGWPAMSYYSGDISQKSVYTDGDNNISVEAVGVIEGYNSAWSNTETQIMDVTVTRPDWSMQYQIRPSVSVNKTLQYAENEPTAISFRGNYKEIMNNTSGLQYDILVLPNTLAGTPLNGSASISSPNTFEQLIAPDTAYLLGHPAEGDIAKLYAMSILTGNAKEYQPAQAITRAQLVTMVTKAIKLPIERPAPIRSTRRQPVHFVFPDVMPDRPDYPYIMAAYKSGIAIGRGDGMFYADYPIEREEAYTIMINALGLIGLAPDPTPQTQYLDDALISSWAKRPIQAGTTLGLFSPDADGNIRPKANMTKAEAAAVINHIIDYMRSGIRPDYTEHLVDQVN